MCGLRCRSVPLNHRLSATLGEPVFLASLRSVTQELLKKAEQRGRTGNLHYRYVTDLKRSFTLNRAVWIALSLLIAVARLDAQEQSVTGTVVDTAGKPVPEASVTVRTDDGAAVATLTTDANGHFSSPIAAGSYIIEVTSPGFARATRTGVRISGPTTEELEITLNVDVLAQSVTVNADASLAATVAPSGNTFEATSAVTEISGTFIRNFLAPTTDFAELVNFIPGAFSLNANGIGLGQGKTYFRGFGDGQYTMTFDGVPFGDTNQYTHHSWAVFPVQWVGSADFDRSPGRASDYGFTNYGGSENMRSQILQADPDIRATLSYGSFKTRLMELAAESGKFGPGGKSSLLVDVHQLLSNGYETFNYQHRDGGSGKYQYRFNDRTTLTLFGSEIVFWAHTPDKSSPTRAQIAEYGDNFLLQSNEFTSPGVYNPLFYGFARYHVQSDFEYAGYDSYLGRGWVLNAKVYTNRYWNKEDSQSGATFSVSTSKPSGVNKLNGYRHAGETLTVSQQSKWGIFRTGVWYDWAYTDRYSIPEDLITGVDTPLGTYHEHFISQTYQPFAEFEWHVLPKLVITAGVKDANYGMALNQFQDNGKTVGCLGGVLSTYPASVTLIGGAPECIGGVAFVKHALDTNNVLPNLTARYHLAERWSVYAQFAEGDSAPLSAIFDVPGGNVLSPPKPTTAKAYQAGSVLKYNRFTFDMDAYYVHFQNGYDSYVDPTTNEEVYVPTGPTNTKGIEFESTFVLGHGLSLYVNGSKASAKYQTGPSYPNGGEWVADTPRDIEDISVFWQRSNWDVGLVNKRVGKMWNDNATYTYTVDGLKVAYPLDQAVAIDPFDLVNFYVNYTLKNSSWLRGSKIRLSVNNLLNSHNIVGVTPALAGTPTVPYVANSADQLNLLPGRSITLTITTGYAPKR